MMMSMSLHAQERKHPKLAMLYSAVVPGMGELYGGNSTKAAIFLSTEAAAWLSVARLNQEVKWAKTDFMRYAMVNAGVPLNSSSDVYSLMENYRSSSVYNQDVELTIRNNLIYLVNDPSTSEADRQKYADWLNDPVQFQEILSDYIYTGSKGWNWNSDASYHHYNKLRENRQHLIIYKNFAVSATILNHIISVVDAAIVTKKWNHFHDKYGELQIQPDFQNKGASLVYTMHF